MRESIAGVLVVEPLSQVVSPNNASNSLHFGCDLFVWRITHRAPPHRPEPTAIKISHIISIRGRAARPVSMGGFHGGFVSCAVLCSHHIERGERYVSLVRDWKICDFYLFYDCVALVNSRFLGIRKFGAWRCALLVRRVVSGPVVLFSICEFYFHSFYTLKFNCERFLCRLQLGTIAFLWHGRGITII